MPTEFRLHEVLADQGLTPWQVATLSGVSYRTVARLCQNETAQVSLATLDKLAKALKVAPGDLIARRR